MDCVALEYVYAYILAGPFMYCLKESRDVKFVGVLMTKEADAMPNIPGGTLNVSISIHNIYKSFEIIIQTICR